MGDSDPSTHVVVVGAGLAGSMTALMLAQKGYQVRVYERNSDFRRRSLRSAEDDGVFGVSKNAVKRSINLALSYRGQCALEKVGLLDEAMKLAVAMPRRVMHDTAGNLTFQPYGTKGEAIHSISREDLNRLLLDALDALPNAEVFFNHKLLSMPRTGGLVFDHEAVRTTVPQPQLIIGADGAYSVVRSQMLKATRADFSRHYIAHGYKELDIPATAEGEFALPNPNGLHIWPRGNFMMIALPNPDKTFTCTLFAPFEGEDSFESLSSPDAVRAFFEKHFPDAVPLMPSLLDDFARNPTGPLVTVRVDPWNHGERVLLLGDAAHAVVPFYGQGMNAAFEDALCLIEEVEASGGRLGPAVKAFATSRQPAGDGIAQLSFHNYVEMRSHTASSAFLLRKRVESVLNAVVPSWIPLYSMVAFTRIPYHEALKRGQAQDRILTTATYAATAALLAGAGALAFSLFRAARR